MECKQGDIAFIKKAMRPANIGLIVHCTEYLGYYLEKDIIQISGENWVAPTSDNYFRITSTSGSIETLFGKSASGYIPETWLTPIKPQKIGTETEEKLLEEV